MQETISIELIYFLTCTLQPGAPLLKLHQPERISLINNATNMPEVSQRPKRSKTKTRKLIAAEKAKAEKEERKKNKREKAKKRKLQKLEASKIINVEHSKREKAQVID